MKKILKKMILPVAVIAALGTGSAAYAATSDSTNFTQVITAGLLSTFIGDASGVEVASPNVVFPSTAVSTSVQTSVGIYGTNTERIYVDNPAAATGALGWTLTFAATSGPSANWTNGTNTYPFNAASSALGQLTIDPTPGTLTAVVGTTTGITKGSAATFSGGTNGPVTILNASSASDDINRVYLTGVTASQTIPASTPAGTYTINFTQTVAAV